LRRIGDDLSSGCNSPWWRLTFVATGRTRFETRIAEQVLVQHAHIVEHDWSCWATRSTTPGPFFPGGQIPPAEPIFRSTVLHRKQRCKSPFIASCNKSSVREMD
jgi:hypothetical protein